MFLSSFLYVFFLSFCFFGCYCFYLFVVFFVCVKNCFDLLTRHIVLEKLALFILNSKSLSHSLSFSLSLFNIPGLSTDGGASNFLSTAKLVLKGTFLEIVEELVPSISPSSKRHVRLGHAGIVHNSV